MSQSLRLQLPHAEQRSSRRLGVARSDAVVRTGEIQRARPTRAHRQREGRAGGDGGREAGGVIEGEETTDS